MIGVDRYAYATITTAGTYSISTTPAVIHTVNINDTTAGTLRICDGTATTAATLASILAGTPGTQLFDAELGQGLSARTNQNLSVTITYAKFNP